MKSLKPIISYGIFLLLLSGCSWFTGSESTSIYDDANRLDSSGIELPMGMNIPDISASNLCYVFSDVMTTASSFKTYAGSEWESGYTDEIEVDDDGYPTYLPQSTSDGNESMVRFMINDNYPAGNYRIFYDGTGTLSGYAESDDEGYYVTLTGNGNNIWINMEYSDASDPITNMHIIHEDFAVTNNDEYEALVEAGGYDTFHYLFLEGLEDFHCLRFMDLTGTNDSEVSEWEDRRSSTYYTQAGETAWEYIIDLCNELQCDAWICVPHAASNDYISTLAQLFYDDLDSNLKVYVEYSNEVWNWQFDQASWLTNNGSDDIPVADDEVLAELEEIGDAGYYQYRKMGYMMARTIGLWEDVFGTESERIVRIVSGQLGYDALNSTVLDWAMNEYSTNVDALTCSGYFYFSTTQHEEWVELSENNELSYAQMYEDVMENSEDDGSFDWARSAAAIATDYGVDYICYEGGQHMQSYSQLEWDYSQMLYDFQVTNYMYNLYVNNFSVQTEEEVDCQLFMAYNYASERESQYGSWGHLESLDQIEEGYSDAPKYEALLDMNTAQ